jgi:uncharacterized membrane protein YgdD (TMEM256/DUF423 family)
VNITATAAAMLALGVTLGAFGAHGLQDRLDEYSLGVYQTGVLYHFIHALGMLAIPVLAKFGLVTERAATWAARLLLVGIVLFSGSLYVLAISGVTILGAVTPFGGLAFIAGWLALAWGAMKN